MVKGYRSVIRGRFIQAMSKVALVLSGFRRVVMGIDVGFVCDENGGSCFPGTLRLGNAHPLQSWSIRSVRVSHYTARSVTLEAGPFGQLDAWPRQSLPVIVSPLI